ncbi:MAG: hypothetical protein ACXVEF_09655 [Polyangiales bacterium]
MLRKLRFLLPLFVLPAFIGCPEPTVPGGGKGGPRSDKANQWFKRANEELSALDLEEAKDSIKQAQTAAPGDAEIGILAGRIALARLDFPEAQKSLEGIEGSEASGLRARAFWYGDDLPHAAEELSHALEDPNFKDSWAKPVRELAGTQGTGRKPFTVKDNSARLVEIRMPRDLGTVLEIPCEVDGQATVAIIDTGVPEVILDTKSRSSPGWVSFKFSSADGTRSIEVRDVPSFVQDLSPFTKGQTVPVGAVLGMNFLRRLHLTFDRLADQIVIRREEPPPPPAMTRVPTGFFNGGGMLIRSTVRKEFEISSALWVNTGTDVPLAFPDAIWKRVGIDVKNLTTTNGQTVGRLTNVRVGPLDVGPADAHAGIPQLEEALARFKGIDVMGQVGMNFLTGFRVTFAEGGRALWLETDQNTPLVIAPPQSGSPKPPPAPPPPAPSTSAKPAPSASVPPKPSAAPKPAPAAPKPSASAKK